MTCDTSRPCQRCVAKGLAQTCEDAPRKRKKYLADVPPDLLHPRRQPAQHQPAAPLLLLPPHFAAVPLRQNHSTPAGFAPFAPEAPYYSAVPPRKSNFLLSAADLEYSTLSSILQDNFASLAPATLSEATPALMSPLSPLLRPHVATPMAPRYTPEEQHDAPVKYDRALNQFFLGPVDTAAGGGARHLQEYPEVISAIEGLRQLAAFRETSAKLKLLFVVADISGAAARGTNGSAGAASSADAYVSSYLDYREPEEIYQKVTRPYLYTPGYHQLIAYLRKRFPKPMLVKMTESMASYRPLFIACTNLLKEEDLIFMEQCFQRTLLTYDNFIHVSGTPTIVWRRTGEIAYVGDEFCMLTGWARDELVLKKKTFIVELLDDKSVLEYFQLFLRIAFGDFLGATMTECTLLTPRVDVKIRTGCIWTLKRDVFGIPMMVIGNFLPIAE
jgi:PAS domain-containing protein